MNVCIVDLDMVVVDNIRRMEIAETKREFYRQHLGDCLPDALANPINHASVQKAFDALLESLYWQTAFNPSLVALDTLIAGVTEALVTLRSQGYRLIYLTSRPESMRDATELWLYEHDVLDGKSLVVMKPTAFTQPPPNHTKTAIWKAGMVQTLARLYVADNILVVDDSEDVRQAILTAYPFDGDFYMVRVVASLAEAVAPASKQDTDNPF